jgi:hypothetical protein
MSTSGSIIDVSAMSSVHMKSLLVIAGKGISINVKPIYEDESMSPEELVNALLEVVSFFRGRGGSLA